MRRLWTAKGHHAKKDTTVHRGRRHRGPSTTTNESHALRLRPGSDTRRRPAAGVRNRRKDLPK